VGNYGQGVKKTVQAFTQAGMENVTMRLYPLCRHEVLNELNREEVYHNIIDWIAKQVLCPME
jgi:alpha-beta hydrolase superfamily lysophospholipase